MDPLSLQTADGVAFLTPIEELSLEEALKRLRASVRMLRSDVNQELDKIDEFIRDLEQGRDRIAYHVNLHQEKVDALDRSLSGVTELLTGTIFEEVAEKNTASESLEEFQLFQSSLYELIAKFVGICNLDSPLTYSDQEREIHRLRGEWENALDTINDILEKFRVEIGYFAQNGSLIDMDNPIQYPEIDSALRLINELKKSLGEVADQLLTYLIDKDCFESLEKTSRVVNLLDQFLSNHTISENQARIALSTHQARYIFSNEQRALVERIRTLLIEKDPKKKEDGVIPFLPHLRKVSAASNPCALAMSSKEVAALEATGTGRPLSSPLVRLINSLEKGCKGFKYLHLSPASLSPFELAVIRMIGLTERVFNKNSEFDGDGWVPHSSIIQQTQPPDYYSLFVPDIFKGEDFGQSEDWVLHEDLYMWLAMYLAIYFADQDTRQNKFPDGNFVASLLVSSNGKILSWGLNTRTAGLVGHAEFNALNAFFYAHPHLTALPKGTTLFTSLQSCEMCAEAIRESFQSDLKVVYGQKEKNELKTTISANEHQHQDPLLQEISDQAVACNGIVAALALKKMRKDYLGRIGKRLHEKVDLYENLPEGNQVKSLLALLGC